MLTSISIMLLTIGLFMMAIKFKTLQKILEMVELNTQKMLKDQAEFFLAELNHVKKRMDENKIQRKKGGNPYPRTEEHKRKLSEAAKRREVAKRQSKAITLPYAQSTGTSSESS